MGGKRNAVTAGRLLICLFLALLLLFDTQAVFAKQYDPADLGTYSYSEKQLEKKQPAYESKPLSFQYSHQPLDPLSAIPKPRYTRTKTGMYKSLAKGDGTATIMLTGDLMCQSRQQRAALEQYGEYRFDDSFYYVRRVFKNADLVVGNLETTLSESASYMSEEGRVDGRPNCNAPSTYLDALRYAGFDLLVTANNHICDGGLRGILQTDAHLNQYGFMHTGTFTVKNEKRYVLAKVDGIKVGFLSYTRYYNNRHLNFTPDGRKTLLNKYSAKKVKRDVKALKAAGAEYIIAYIHWGTEYKTTPDKAQKETAREMADAGVDCIIGSHPHVIQPCTTIRASDGRKVQVFYSLGNFVSHMDRYDTTKDSLIVRLRLKRNSKGKVYLAGKKYIPCRCVTKYNGRNYAVVPVTKKRTETVKCREELIRSSKRIKKILGKDIDTLSIYKL